VPEQSAERRTIGPESPDEEDLYPVDEAQHRALVSWCTQAFQAAESARNEHLERWRRWYKLFRSYIKREKGDWRSKAFIAIPFWVVEVITPRLVSQLPKFLALPVGPEDVEPAKTMETTLEWSAQNSDLYLELVKATKSALKYGTGILKTYWREDIRRGRRLVPELMPVTMKTDEPVIDPETGMPLMDPDGQPVVESREVEVSQVQVGQKVEYYYYKGYDGPAAEAVDLFNFWVAPEATDIQSARFLIHRVYREWSYIERMVKRGIYKLPDNLKPGDAYPNTEDEPLRDRMASIDMDTSGADSTRKPVEVLEFWLDDGRVITMANRRAILRVSPNPFDHGEKPFARIVDHLAEHEFYGVGEIEVIEGLVDLRNVIANSRVDNLRMVLQAMFFVDTSALVDLKDLQLRPGGFVRVNTQQGGLDNVIKRIEMGDVTPTAFVETEQIDNAIERITGVSNYTMGQDSPSANDTATGVNLLQQAGDIRFALKSRLMELMGLKDVARQWGANCQQFITEEKLLRLFGPRGVLDFMPLSPESIQGSFDFDIEVSSATQTEGRKRFESMSLLQTLSGYIPQGVMAMVEDVLEAFGKKDIDKYMNPPGTMIGPDGKPMMLPPGMPILGIPPGMPPGQNPEEPPPLALSAGGPEPTPPPSQGGQVLPFPGTAG
jgi:hypothetical protein